MQNSFRSSLAAAGGNASGQRSACDTAARLPTSPSSCHPAMTPDGSEHTAPKNPHRCCNLCSEFCYRFRLLSSWPCIFRQMRVWKNHSINSGFSRRAGARDPVWSGRSHRWRSRSSGRGVSTLHAPRCLVGKRPQGAQARRCVCVIARFKRHRLQMLHVASRRLLRFTVVLKYSLAQAPEWRDLPFDSDDVWRAVDRAGSEPFGDRGCREVGCFTEASLVTRLDLVA